MTALQLAPENVPFALQRAKEWREGAGPCLESLCPQAGSAVRVHMLGCSNRTALGEQGEEST